MTTQNNLKHMSRGQLIEIMLAQSKKIDQLTRENEELREKLEKKEMTIARCGSIAEASIRLSGVFEAAQKAADIYLTNLESLLKETEQKDAH